MNFLIAPRFGCRGSDEGSRSRFLWAQSRGSFACSQDEQLLSLCSEGWGQEGALRPTLLDFPPRWSVPGHSERSSEQQSWPRGGSHRAEQQEPSSPAPRPKHCLLSWVLPAVWLPGSGRPCVDSAVPLRGSKQQIWAVRGELKHL